MSRDRRLPLVVVALSIAALGLHCKGKEAAAPAHVPAAKVESPVKEADLATIKLTPEAETRLGIVTVPVERKTLARTRTVGGEVIAAPGAETLLTAPFAGTLETPDGAPVVGATVGAGRALFRLIPLSPAERDAQVDAERTAAESEARREAAEQRERRVVQLERDGAASRRDVEAAVADLKVAEADAKAARDRLALVSRGGGAGGEGVALESPYRALVRDVHASAGQVVPAGAPLVDLARLEAVWVRVPLYVGEVNEIDTAGEARVVGLADPPETAGVAAQPVPSSLAADAATAGAALFYSLPNPGDAMRPGQRVGVRLRAKSSAEGLVVPEAALLHDAYGGSWVYEASAPQVYKRRRVVVRDLVDGWAVLDRGPEPGTRVVTDGAAELFGTEFGAGK